MTERTTAATGGSATARPKRQEQEEASDEIVEVAPSILRLQLPIDFTGLGHVNTYALEDGDGFALVDPGLPGEKSWKVLQQRLDAAGIPLARVHTVFVTHSHPDHFGGAGLLAEESGARVVTSEFFRTFFDAADMDDTELDDAGAALADDAGDTDDDSDDPFVFRNAEGHRIQTPFGRPTPWGGVTEGPPPERIAEMRANWEDTARWFRPPRPTHRLADADHITLAGREWVALYTPGHTDDHLCLFDPEAGVMLAGDHVLPTITPHISGLIEGDALALYVESLDRIAALDGITLVLPAHGHPFTDLAGRVDEVKEHHEERLEHLRGISEAEGWATVQALSHKLFAERSWGSMAESETYAHLEHLRVRGLAERRRANGYLEFAAT